MDPVDWLVLLGLGAALGMLGQVIRVLGGLKKLSDQAAAVAVSRSELFHSARLVISLIIGAAAGGLAAVSLRPSGSLASADIVSLIGAGFAGTDFLEAFITRSLPEVGVRAAPPMREAAPPASPAVG